MMRRLTLFYTVFYMLALLLPGRAQQNKVDAPVLAAMAAEKKITVVNRNIVLLKDGVYGNGLHLDEKEGDGLAWLQGIQFTNGTIEFDTKGRDLLQQSFVGIAFHGLDNGTFEAIYFRPFNFKATDSARRSHCVQYISLPAYDWPTLRKSHPNKYEQPVNPAPDPVSWIHARIKVDQQQISVYVNNNPSPSLVVTRLSDRKNGMIGFWTGNHSDGDFANLRITNEE